MAERKIVATYDYCDEQGRLLYQVVRFEPKDFSQRRLGQDGQLVYDLAGVRRVPYRLPELLASAGPIYVVEGERDVETLVALGLTATCNSGGAGNWPVEHGRYFKGRDAVLIPDNDGSGQTHCCQVASSLVYWGARSIRIVNLFPLPAGGDVTDFVNDRIAGVSDEQMLAALIAQVEKAPVWKRG